MLFVDHPGSLPIVKACSPYGLGLSLKFACICVFVYFYRWPICPSPSLPIAWGSHDNLKLLWARNCELSICRPFVACLDLFICPHARCASEELGSLINWPGGPWRMFLQLKDEILQRYKDGTQQRYKDGPFHDRLISPIHKTVMFVKS